MIIMVIIDIRDNFYLLFSDSLCPLFVWRVTHLIVTTADSLNTSAVLGDTLNTSALTCLSQHMLPHSNTLLRSDVISTLLVLARPHCLRSVNDDLS